MCYCLISSLFKICLFMCVFKKPVPPTVFSHSVCMLSMKVISIIDISHYFSINAENIEWLVWALLLTYWDTFFFIFRLKSAYKCIIKVDSVETLPVINKTQTTGQLLENPGFTNSTAQLQARLIMPSLFSVASSWKNNLWNDEIKISYPGLKSNQLLLFNWNC